MSLIIAIFVPTGIVISGDSRTTIQLQKDSPNINGGVNSLLTSLVLSDAANKVFSIFNKYGVGTFGDAIINNLPIEHYIEDFQSTRDEVNNITELLDSLLLYFRGINPNLNTYFFVSGYENNEPFVYELSISQNQYRRKNLDNGQIIYGLLRGGDTDIVNRIFTNPDLIPRFNVMNIQDAIDFSRHLIRATIDQMRFEPKYPSVGGEIDTLLVTRDKSKYIYKKELQCS